jgi:transcription-repair coupling factor (superfamily II helicase)
MGFPYEETEDQLGAIQSTLKDLESGRADKLVYESYGIGGWLLWGARGAAIS